MFRRGIASEIRWLLLYLFGAMLLGAALDAVLATLLYAALVYIALVILSLASVGGLDGECAPSRP